ESQGVLIVADWHTLLCREHLAVGQLMQLPTGNRSGTWRRSGRLLRSRHVAPHSVLARAEVWSPRNATSRGVVRPRHHDHDLLPRLRRHESTPTCTRSVETPTVGGLRIARVG